jgi:aspartyl-tRNA synthetase
MTRARVNHITRNHFTDQGFLELETPFMVKYTPGGARNFLVPSRLNPGRFYALAESPQLFKQLYMIAGFDRYFQIVRCFRDEDLRLDRQPEFTQIDVEMSFVEQNDVFEVIEGLVVRLWKEILGVELSRPFLRMPFDESMAKYGNDKPDLRFDMPHVVLTELVRQHDGGGLPLLEEAVRAKGIVKAMRVPASANLSRTEIDKLEEYVKGMGAKGLARAKVGEGGEWTQSPFAKTVTPALRQAINAACDAQPGDLLLFQFGKESVVHTVMANLRVHLAKRMGLIPEYGSGGQWRFLWVVNPPLFEFDEESGQWAAAHHAFTRPHDSDVQYLETDPGRVNCYRYDLVLNGFEIGGGSIRLHDPVVQARVFKARGSRTRSEEQVRLPPRRAQDGAPPHARIALGMDRLVMLLTGAESLRDVVAWPKTQKGTDLMTARRATWTESSPRGVREVDVRAEQVGEATRRGRAGARGSVSVTFRAWSTSSASPPRPRIATPRSRCGARCSRRSRTSHARSIGTRLTPAPITWSRSTARAASGPGASSAWTSAPVRSGVRRPPRRTGARGWARPCSSTSSGWRGSAESRSSSSTHSCRRSRSTGTAASFARVRCSRTRASRTCSCASISCHDDKGAADG